MMPKVRRALVLKAEQALKELESEFSLFGVEADAGRLATVAFGLRALVAANEGLATELERLLKLYDQTGNWKQLVVWLRKTVATEKATL